MHLVGAFWWHRLLLLAATESTKVATVAKPSSITAAATGPTFAVPATADAATIQATTLASAMDLP